MNYNEFLDELICTGIEGARKDYAKNPDHLLGSIAGFKACSGKSPDQLLELLSEAAFNMNRACVEQVPDYWAHACFWNEIHWVCNCVSCVLVIEGFDPIMQPTHRAMIHTYRILNSAPANA